MAKHKSDDVSVEPMVGDVNHAEVSNIEGEGPMQTEEQVATSESATLKQQVREKREGAILALLALRTKVEDGVVGRFLGKKGFMGLGLGEEFDLLVKMGVLQLVGPCPHDHCRFYDVSAYPKLELMRMLSKEGKAKSWAQMKRALLGEAGANLNFPVKALKRA